MIIPESWSHGVLNIQVDNEVAAILPAILIKCLQESIAVATEAKAFHWRAAPGFRTIMDAIPKVRPVGLK